MNIEQYTYLLENPQHIENSHTSQIKEVIEAFPFFQSAHALHLKCLKNEGSFSYNNALKKTAAHTVDRAVLFDFITSNEFLQNDISSSIKEQDQRLRAISIVEEEDLSTEVEQQEQNKASQILDPGLFVVKEDSMMTRPVVEESLQLGTPLPFTKSESHSFGEWLKLASFQPIDRSSDPEKAVDNDSTTSPEISDTIITKTIVEADENLKGSTLKKDLETTKLSKKRKQKIVDSFIENNPKISRATSNKTKKTSPSSAAQFSPDALMTETLARVYVEQKNYKKAKQAFRILSLKYPEKSGFFADQIRAVEQLEEQ
ncbi:hypothetical protein [Dokdonia sp. Hel_I_53]|uniref:hypothetical protein n=1 Tax=Dokdonia sp. Hel_I_53 TaxID=1566287 RepID=UPI00119B79E3|nr:hypothetical protein [Dokdonia sp. Hel_I_53]TVZ52154.1 hypothetical protein OD90_1319 [Dokdonia sp. Hel_I_53]